MANFARGLQAGLPVGLALGEGVRDRRERRAYQEAAEQFTTQEKSQAISTDDSVPGSGASPHGPGAPPAPPTGLSREQIDSDPSVAGTGRPTYVVPGMPDQTFGSQQEAMQASFMPGLMAQYDAAMQLGDVQRAGELANQINTIQTSRAQVAQGERGLDISENRLAFDIKQGLWSQDFEVEQFEESVRQFEAVQDLNRARFALDRETSEQDYQLARDSFEQAAEQFEAEFGLTLQEFEANLPFYEARAEQAQIDADRSARIEEEAQRIRALPPEERPEAAFSSGFPELEAQYAKAATSMVQMQEAEIALEALQASNAINKAFREAQGDPVAFFSELEGRSEGDVFLADAEDEYGRHMYRLGVSIDGKEQLLPFSGRSERDLLLDIYRLNSPEFMRDQLQEVASNHNSSMTPAERRNVVTNAFENSAASMGQRMGGDRWAQSLVSGERDNILIQNIDSGEFRQAIDQMATQLANAGYALTEDVIETKFLNNLVYDLDNEEFFIPAGEAGGQRITANIFVPGSEWEQQAITQAQAIREEQERDRQAAMQAAMQTMSGPVEESDEPFLFNGPAYLQSVVDDVSSSFVFRERPENGWFGPGGFRGSPAGQTFRGLFSQGGEEPTPEPEPEPELDMADGGLVEASREATRRKWRERAATGIRANQQAQRSMEGEAAPSAPLAYQPLNDTSPMERMQTSRVPAPRNMADGGLARKDMRGGGEVNGPGTATSDSIPARLSDGEYVLNAETVEMVGEDYLDKINNAGLRRRDSRKRK